MKTAGRSLVQQFSKYSPQTSGVSTTSAFGRNANPQSPSHETLGCDPNDTVSTSPLGDSNSRSSLRNSDLLGSSTEGPPHFVDSGNRLRVNEFLMLP